MPTKTILGGVFTTDLDGGLTGTTQVSTENVCGLIFDTSVVGGIATALGQGLAKTTFGNGNVVELNTKKDIAETGIDETVMGGLPLYHLNTFFTLAGDNRRLFVTFMDSTSDTEFGAVERLQTAANGIIYQIGVWTGKPIASKGDGDIYSVIDNGILGKLQSQAEVLGGKIGVTNYEGHSPVSVLVTAPVILERECDYKKLPDISNLGCPKVTMLLGQPASAEVHNIMIALGSMVPVGCVGAALAVLAVAPVDQNIGNVRSYNLGAAINNVELGFGNLAVDDGSKNYTSEAAFTNIKSLGYSNRSNYLHSKGYVFLTDISGIEGGVFFSSDQTLACESDYRSIARCRTMHKARRVVRQALLPYVNNTVDVEVATGTLTASAVTEILNTIIGALDNNMVGPTGASQISGRTASVDTAHNVLEDDAIRAQFGITPHGCSSAIFCTEGFATTA